MCGRVTLKTDAQAISEAIGDGLLLSQDLAPLLEPRYNLAPTQGMLCARRPHGEVRLRPSLMRWGLVPYWSKDLSGGAKMINARSETVFEKPAFRAAAKARRCIAIVDGFYEWRRPEKGPKVPFHFRLRSGRPFAIAALWESWRATREDSCPGGGNPLPTLPAEGSPVETCTLLTTGANAILEPIHDRMPVILEGPGVARWLDPDAQGREALGPLLAPLDASLMEGWPVSTRVNGSAPDDAALLDRVEDPPPPPLRADDSEHAPPAAAPGRRSRTRPKGGGETPREERHEQGTLF